MLALDDYRDKLGNGAAWGTTRISLSNARNQKGESKGSNENNSNSMGSTLAAYGDINRNVMARLHLIRQTITLQSIGKKVADLLTPMAGKALRALGCVGLNYTTQNPTKILKQLGAPIQDIVFGGIKDELLVVNLLPRK